MPWSVYLNETSLADLGVYPERVTVWGDAPTREYPTVAIPGRMGVVFAADPVVPPRTLRIACLVQPAALTLAARRAAEDGLKLLASRGLIKIIYDDGVTAPRTIDGVCLACTVTPRRHPVVSLVSDAELTVLCPDPTWADVTGQVIGFSTTATAIPLGTSVSGGLVRIAAPAWSANVQNLVLGYYTAGGVLVGSMTFTITLTAGTDFLEIDLDRATVTKSLSGTVTNAITTLTAGDFFALDPTDGDPLAGSYPLLKVTASTGTPSGQWLGVRRWL